MIVLPYLYWVFPCFTFVDCILNSERCVQLCEVFCNIMNNEHFVMSWQKCIPMMVVRRWGQFSLKGKSTLNSYNVLYAALLAPIGTLSLVPSEPLPLCVTCATWPRCINLIYLAAFFSPFTMHGTVHTGLAVSNLSIGENVQSIGRSVRCPFDIFSPYASSAMDGRQVVSYFELL